MTTLSLSYLGQAIRERTLENILGDVQNYTNMKAELFHDYCKDNYTAEEWKYINNVLLRHADVMDDTKDVKKGVARYLLLHQRDFDQHPSRDKRQSEKALSVTQYFIHNVTDVTLWGEMLGHHFKHVIQCFDKLTSYEQRYLLLTISKLSDYPWSNQYGWRRPLLQSVLGDLEEAEMRDVRDNVHLKCIIIGLLKGAIDKESNHLDYLSSNYMMGYDIEDEIEYDASDVHSAFALYLADIEPTSIDLSPEDTQQFETLKTLKNVIGNVDIITWLNIDAVELTDYVGEVSPLSISEMELQI